MRRSASSFTRDFILRLLLLGLISFFGLTLISPFVPWNRPVAVASIRNSTLRTTVQELNNRTIVAPLTLSPPFYPNLALYEYQKRHSVFALRDDVSLDNRKFAIAYWSCPDRAGNILHNFFNSILWAMITNRTVLWMYGDGRKTGFASFDECSNSLQIADWIPSYHDFHDVLPFEPEEAVPVPITVETSYYDSVHHLVIFPQIPDVLKGNKQVARNEWQHHPLTRERRDYREYIKALPAIQQRFTGMLYYLKTDYLMGMLFRACFTLLPNEAALTPPLLKAHESSLSVSENGQLNRTAAFSIALHSRHPVISDDGSFVREEMQCLEELVSMSRLMRANDTDSSPANCYVYIISDRPRTLRLLSNHVQGLGCQALVAHHDTNATCGIMSLTEHGPYAGAGYLEDLAFASRARHALVGDASRSSFTLLVEIVTYDRFIEAWRSGSNEIEDLQLCVLQSKSARGYSYGPGTPNFVHHTRLKPLQPEAVLQTYQSLHGVSSLHQTSDARYLRVNWSCDEQSIQTLLNGFLFAILTNRTMMVERASDNPFCLDILSLASWIPSHDKIASIVDMALDSFEDEPATLNASTVPASGNLEITFLIEAAASQARVVDFPDRSSIMPLLESSQNDHRFNPELEERIRRLTAEGTDFLYGMLFFAAFQFSSSVRNSVGGPAVPLSLLDVTDEGSDEHEASLQMHAVAIDARNWDYSLEHGDTADCLSSAIDTMPSLSSCKLFVLADADSQDSTIERLSKWVLESSSFRHCTVASPPLRNISTSPLDSTLGGEDMENWLFLARVAWLSSRIRWAYVGPSAVTTANGTQHSSMLPLQLIQYQRRTEMWHQGRDPPVLPRDMFVCAWQS